MEAFDDELLFTDRSSLTYVIKPEDVYEEFFQQKHLFDFRNFLKDSKFCDSQYKMAVDKMKVEHKGTPIKGFVGLKSKMHSMLSNDSNVSNTAEEMNTATEFNEFKDTLFDKKVIRHKMKRIQGKKHKIGTYEINKTLLLCFDGKIFVLGDGIHKLAHFHKDLQNRSLHIIMNKRDSQR